MKSKYPGTCKACGNSFPKDTEIYYDPSTKSAKHASKECSGVAAKDKPKGNLAKLKEAREPSKPAAPAKKPDKRQFKKLTTVEVMKLLPAYKAFSEAVAETNINLENYSEERLAEVFRVLKIYDFDTKKAKEEGDVF